MYTLISLNSKIEVAQAVAKTIMNVVEKNPSSTLMLATGETPTLAYEEVSKRLKKLNKKFDKLKIHKLDEWAGLGANDKTSCEYYLREQVLAPWGIEPFNYTGADGKAIDLERECELCSDVLAGNGADLCLLGIGTNGHIGFNEPSHYLNPHTSVVDLSESSMKHPMIEGNKSITQGVTTGIVEIMESKEIILMATGFKKREILDKLLSGPITTSLPASMLLLHPNLTIICDVEACRD